MFLFDDVIVSPQGAEGGFTEASTLQIPHSCSTQLAKGADTDSFPSATHTPSSQNHPQDSQVKYTTLSYS